MRRELHRLSNPSPGVQGFNNLNGEFTVKRESYGIVGAPGIVIKLSYKRHNKFFKTYYDNSSLFLTEEGEVTLELYVEEETHVFNIDVLGESCLIVGHKESYAEHNGVKYPIEKIELEELKS